MGREDSEPELADRAGKLSLESSVDFRSGSFEQRLRKLEEYYQNLLSTTQMPEGGITMLKDGIVGLYRDVVQLAVDRKLSQEVNQLIEDIHALEEAAIKSGFFKVYPTVDAESQGLI